MTFPLLAESSLYHYTRPSASQMSKQATLRDWAKPSPSNRRAILVSTAQNTKALLPQVLDAVPQAPPKGYRYSHIKIPMLDPKYCPNLNSQVQIVNRDTLDIALDLTHPTTSPQTINTKNVCVLNMASEKHAGGGWLRGALAQEEELCYRSSLSFTLKLRYYPLGVRDAIYSPTVVVFRENFKKFHRLMDLQSPQSLPIVSVISMAALRRPRVDRSTHPPKFKSSADREVTKDKMRLILRIAAYNKHRRLILGALGCGAFENPKEEVADCWAEVLQEPEFQGWWESIVFAVLEDQKDLAGSDGNFSAFHTKLHGLKV